MLILLGLILSGCISDAVTTSSAVRLSFSRDTVNFDTVFTGLGTPTARLIVRNPDSKGVSISSISLASASSCFSLNVDGVSGRDFADVEIMGKDSIFVFIECLLPETSSIEPTLTTDQLVFVTNGTRQEVRLEAYGQNVRRLRAMEVTGNDTIDATLPVVVFDSLVVSKDAVLTILPGAKLLFHDGAELKVRGRLNACGAPGAMIQMRGDRLDNVLPNVGYDILAGQWKGIRIFPSSSDNRMEYTDMRSTIWGLLVDSCPDPALTRLTLLNSWLHNSQMSVLTATHARISATGCVFSEAANAVVSLTGGDLSFLQCTFANYYLFSAISQPIVSLYHLFPSDRGSAAPLMKARFENSIIYGLASDINEGDLEGSDVYFRNVSFKANVTPDANFINCLGDCDPLFLTDRPKYYFNYHVRSDSPVIGKGDPAFLSGAALYDMDGFYRLENGNPVLGAYARSEAQEQ